MEQVETLPDDNLRVSQKPETTTAVVHEQMSLWSPVVPSVDSIDHPLQAGPDDGYNIRLGADIIQALNNGEMVTLQLNPLGGGVTVTGEFGVSGSVTSDGPFTFSGGATDLGSVMSGKTITIDGSDLTTMSGNIWKHTYPASGVVECSVLFAAPPSGKVFILFGARMESSVAGTRAQCTIELFQGEDDTGTRIIEPLGDRSIDIATANASTGSWFWGSANLIPGENYYVRLSQRMANNTGFGTIWGRYLTVIPRM